MSIKAELRKIKKLERHAVTNKEHFSQDISSLLTSSELYKRSNIILCYAFIGDEVNADSIIKKAFEDSKIVALPKCLDNEGNMEFYIINSFDDLTIDFYGIREPITSKCEKLTYFENAIIIVPAICFDKNGYRLGYGKGFYDRYLQKHPLISVGLCYNSLVNNELPYDSYDIPVDYIITEKQIITCCDGGRNGK